jgi:hypothetical protein
MNNNSHRLSRPVYELLPYLYMALGLLGFLGAWLMAGSLWSDVLLVLGAAGVVVGFMIFLRRRDYRANKERYNSSSLKDQ